MECGLREELIEIYQPDYLYLPEELGKDFENMEVIWQEDGYRLLKL